MKLNIASKYSLILLLPMLAATSVLWAFHSFMDQEEASVSYMNVAGRQRMLSEQLNNYAQMVHVGQEEDRKPLKAMIAKFSDALDALQYGGHLEDLNVDLPAAPAEISTSLAELRRTWKPLKQEMILISDLPATDPDSRMAYAKVNAQAPTLTKAANSVAEAFEAHTTELHLEMRNLLAANAAFTLFLLFLGFWAVRRHIAAPVLQLAEMASAIDNGDYTRRVTVNTQDELGTLADTVNGMAGSIESSILMEREQRQRQKRLAQIVIELGSKPVKEVMIRHVEETAKKITGARYAIITYDLDGKRHHIPFGLTPEQESALADYPPQYIGLLGQLWEERKIVNIENIDEHPKKSALPPAHPPIKNFLGVPILFGEEMFGVLLLGNKDDGQPFTNEDENTVGMLATACAIAISNTKNIGELKATNSTLEARVTERSLHLKQANQRLRSREIELELTNDELASANEAKNQFLANTSHELRTPLNAIIGFSELLGNKQTGALTEKQLRYVRHVHTSGKRLLTIINDLLDISKIEAGMMDIEETVCIPLHTAQQVASELKPLARAKQICLTLHAGDNAETSVLVDAGKFHQMLVNLVGNAIKFTPEDGKVDIYIQVDKQAKEYHIVTKVRDTGIGINERDQQRIFEPFVQLSGGLDRKEGGTGLGLALTRKQINMLGGDLTIESREEAGSTFTIDLPVQPAETALHAEAEVIQLAAAENVAAAETEDAMPVWGGPRPHILIIDEDETRSAEAIKILMAEGYQVNHSNIEHAISSVQQYSPFLLMLGIPANREELHRYLQLFKEHESTRNVPLVLMGRDDHALKFSMGTVDIVDKGIEQQDLLDVISRHSQSRPAAIRVPTVLVIDDDLSIRQLLKEILVNAGYHALLASHGEEGIRLAIECEPDVIILDLMMPGISGFDVMNRLRQHPATTDIPIVIYTAKDLTRTESLLLGRDAERLLLKGTAGRSEILRQLQKLELMYPVRAHLMDASLDCFNPRYLQLRLEQETAAARRHGQKFSLIGWEIDHYSNYASEHGERWAVAALKEVVELTKDATRLNDVCMHTDTARFVLFLPDITPQGAIHVANKLCIHIRRRHFPLPGEEFGELTASFGVTHFGIDAEDIQPLLQSLNQRINESIRAGGNQCLAEPPMAENI